MKKMFWLFFSVFSFLLFGISGANGAVLVSTEVKQELSSDRQEIKEELRERNDNAQAAKIEEDKLRDQIKAAIDSGDLVLARQLKEQLVALHQENAQEKIEDKKDIQEDVGELKSDIKEAHQEGYLPHRIDKDNNPPGSVGGAGTNWENPPGPRGGPGASPDHREH